MARTPKEDLAISSGYAVLGKAMYGTKDAGACFDARVEVVMRQCGYTVGTFSVCLYFHPETREKVLRHGDDFIHLGTRQQAKAFHEAIGKELLLKHVATLGPTAALGDAQEARCLNRILRLVRPPFSNGEERIEYEPDPRHVEVVLSNMGLTMSSRGLSSPGLREKAEADTVTKLSATDRTAFRSNVMRICYLAQDRIDIQYQSKELARNMQAPSLADYDALKRLCRYLVARPRVVQHFVRQFYIPDRIVVHSDSDFAGCVRTRKGTSSVKIMLGKHLVRSTASTQGVNALSSGEAEFYAAVKGAAGGLGAVAMLRDLGVDLGNTMPTQGGRRDKPVIEVKVDASAGRGVAMRRGAGRIRHIATPTLWLQRYVSENIIAVTKQKGEDNIADLGTKHLDITTMTKHIV